MPTLRSITKVLGPALALVAVWTLFALLVPDGRFTALSNQRLMLIQTAVVGTAAVGATLIIASKGLDLSVGSTIALGTMMIAWLLNQGWHPLAAAAVGGVGVAVCVGSLVGLLVTGRIITVVFTLAVAFTVFALLFKQGLLPIVAALIGGAFGVIGLLMVGRSLPRPLSKLPLSPFIVTLGMLGIVRGLAHGIGGERPIFPPGGSGFLPHLMASATPPPGMPALFVWLPPGVWLLLALSVLMSLVLRRTVLGRRALAIGDNEAAARYAGVPVDTTKIVVYALGVGCAGLAAVLQFSYLTLGDPGTAGGMELAVVAACVIGGASLSGGSASVSGTLLGALLMTVVANGCTKMNLPNWIQMVITGAIILSAVAIDQWRRGERH